MNNASIERLIVSFIEFVLTIPVVRDMITKVVRESDNPADLDVEPAVSKELDRVLDERMEALVEKHVDKVLDQGLDEQVNSLVRKHVENELDDEFERRFDSCVENHSELSDIDGVCTRAVEYHMDYEFSLEDSVREVLDGMELATVDNVIDELKSRL